jgi:hypothetical protein
MNRKSSSHEISSGPPKGELGGEAGGIPVYCRCDAVVPVAELLGNPLNIKTHPKKQIAKYRQVVEALGWRVAVVVSKRSGLVVKGHGAVQMAAEWGKPVPVVYQDFADEAAELEFLAADNYLPALAGTDRTKLRALLGKLQSLDADLTITAIPDEDIRHLVATLEKEEFIMPPGLDDPGEESPDSDPVPAAPASKPLKGGRQLVALVMPMPLFVKWKQVKDSFGLKDDLKVFTKLVETHLENIA